MYQSGKERNDQRNQESNAANQGFHNGPGLEGGFFIHADKALNKPEAGIVKVRADRGTTCDGSGNAGKIQRRQLADAGHGGNNASGHRHGHGRRTNRDANQCRHNERNHDQRQAGGRNCIEMFLTFDIVQPFSICPFQYNTLCIASSTFLPGFIPSSLHIKTPKGQRAVLALWCGIGKHKKENGDVIGCT